MTPARHRKPGRGLRARFPPRRDWCSARGIARAVLRAVRKPQRNLPDRLARMRTRRKPRFRCGIEQIDAAYHTKYDRRCPTIVPSILAPQARAATLRLTPREEET